MTNPFLDPDSQPLYQEQFLIEGAERSSDTVAAFIAELVDSDETNFGHHLDGALVTVSVLFLTGQAEDGISVTGTPYRLEDGTMVVPSILVPHHMVTPLIMALINYEKQRKGG